MRETFSGEKLSAQSFERIWGDGVHARCDKIMVQEFGKRLERNVRPFSLALFFFRKWQEGPLVER